MFTTAKSEILLRCVSEFRLHNREYEHSTRKYWGVYLNSLSSSSTKSDPALSLFMPKFSFRPGRNKQYLDIVSCCSAAICAIMNNILLYTCLILYASSNSE